MKRFACGDVVPGCRARFEGTTEEEILTAVAEHAARDHGIEKVSDDLVSAVRARITSAE